MTAGLPLLETKLYLPKWRADLVSRPRLLDRIHREHTLTLVSASAGFGKTTLLAEWAASAPTDRVAWLSLDPSDNDPAFFWTYLITALQKIQPQLGDRTLTLLHSPQPPPIESVLVTLLNEINTVEEPFALVLDDCHVIENPSIHHAIDFLLGHLPPQLHLIMATRSDPPWPLARLRARGNLNELRSADLRFTSAEVAEFLSQVMGLELSAADVTALEQRTEGWISGLQLAALSMQGRDDVSGFVAAFSGDERYIVDYLLEEVLQRQRDRVRNFLLKTAILERLSGPLCSAVCDPDYSPTESQNLLVELEKSNLFVIPLDNKRHWYRYHHLFADVLQAHARSQQPETLSVLHTRASTWYEQQSSISEAIHHATAAQAFERAARLIEQVWPAMRRRQQEPTVLSWIKALPDPIIRSRPLLSVAYALVLLNDGQLQPVEGYLQDAERWLAEASKTPETREETEQGIDEAQLRALPVAIANTRAYRSQAMGDIESAIAHAQQALDLLPANEKYERATTLVLLGLSYWSSGKLELAYCSFAEGLEIFKNMGGATTTVGGTLVLANMSIFRGQLHQSISLCQQALDMVTRHGKTGQSEAALSGTAEMYLTLSEARYEQGDLDAASQLLSRGQAMRHQTPLFGTKYLWSVVQARLEMAQGNLDTAIELLCEAEQLYYNTAIPNVRPIAAIKAQVWLKQDRLADALDWSREQNLSVDDELSYLREYEHITLANVLIHQYRLDVQRPSAKTSYLEDSIQSVITLLDRLLEAADTNKRTGSIVEISIAQALAYEAQDNRVDAIASLKRALTLTKPQNHIRPFAEAGAPITRLLREISHQDISHPGISSTYLNKILTVSKTWGQNPKEALTPPLRYAHSPLPVPLSPRELEVLRLLNTELTGPEIASELVVALSTIRTHTKRIYSKLDVSNRQAALKKAAELELI